MDVSKNGPFSLPPFPSGRSINTMKVVNHASERAKANIVSLSPGMLLIMAMEVLFGSDVIEEDVHSILIKVTNRWLSRKIL